MGILNGLRKLLSGKKALIPGSEDYEGWSDFGCRRGHGSAYVAFNTFIGTMYNCANGNAKLIAGLPLHLSVPKQGPMSKCLYKWRKSLYLGEDYVDIEDMNSPVVYLFNNPNSIQTSLTSFVYKAIIQLELAGDVYIYIVKENGIPVQLILLNPAYIKIQTDPKSYRIKSYEYTGLTMKTTFQPDEIEHIFIPSPVDDVYGYSPAYGAWQDIQLAINKGVKDLAGQLNLSRPDFIVAMQARSQTELDSATRAIENKLRGIKKTGNFLTVNSAQSQVVPLTYQEYSIGEPEAVTKKIAAAFNYPYSKLVGNDQTKANTSAQLEAWHNDLKFQISLLEEGFNNILKYFPDLEEGAVVWFEDVKNTDMEVMVANSVKNYQYGVIDRYDAKLMQGLEATPEDKGVYSTTPAPTLIQQV
jgi:HK97 family phage portal protein